MIREANVDDIEEIHEVRMAVKENILSNPLLVTTEDYINYLTKRGKGWVFIKDEKVVGFAIADKKGSNIWALFVHPEYEKQGIGKQLHNVMMNWYFSKTTKSIWLSTDPKSRALSFYKKAGWIEIGMYGKGEVKLEMEYQQWKVLQEHTQQVFNV
jgi:GNAT superfamily N-acetyltransferase